MPLKFDVSHFVGPKVQELQTRNLRLQEKVRELETKNAILNLRLAECQNNVQQSREDVIHFKLETETHIDTRNKVLATADETREMVKEIKNDLKTLEEDVSYMFNDVQQIFEGHLENVMNRVEKVKIKDGNITELDKRIEELESALIEANDRHIREKKKRRKLHNDLIELRGNIRVHCRLRPLLAFDNGNLSPLDALHGKGDMNELYGTELGKPGSSSEQVVHAIDDENISVLSTKPAAIPKAFEFEHVYFPGDAQDLIFEEVQPLITSLLDGYNVCIMAYGQTGSGKTHTMLGNKTEPGIVPRAGEELFKLIDEKPVGSVSVQVSVVEVYNNDIYDLLSDNPKEMKHAITTTEEGSLDIVSTIQMQVHNSTDIEKWMEHGLRHRAMMATKVHEHSSRSHLVVTLTVTNHKTVLASPRKPQVGANELDSLTLTPQRVRRQLPQPNLPYIGVQSPRKVAANDEPSSPATVAMTSDSFKTKLQLVDLAGSECVGMSGVTGHALRETSHINRSLSALSDVLGALSEKRSHIPYRNSRLTRLLQDSIGGDAKLLLMLCVSPAQRYLTESLQCLSFGQRARQVQRGPPKKRGYQSVVNEASFRPQSPKEKPSAVRRMQL
uniref:kinesin-like protein KIF25 n=1 Tax=Styela clava TaxID=7725 RepID=UPI00193A37B8|nr:kinesin-like protein KIF25 [Styela clava]